MFVTIGTTPADAAAAVALCALYDNIRCAIGVHPNHSHEVELTAIDELRELSKQPGVVAIGEMGLDYHHHFADVKLQRKFFEAQLALAEERADAWPVVIHCREAVDDALAVLREHPRVPCVFHCFTGSRHEAERIIEAGHHIGFTGPITYKRNDDLRDVVRFVPIDRLLVETDAPYLSPEPVRKQKTCEPAFVSHTLAMVAQVKGITLPEANAITTRNTLAFYQID